MANTDHPLEYKDFGPMAQLSRHPQQRAAIDQIIAAALNNVRAGGMVQKLLDANWELASPIEQRHLLRLAAHEIEAAACLIRALLRATER